MAPFTAPTVAPVSNPTATASSGCNPAAIARPHRKPLKPTIDPTERSMPPVRITKNTPNAIIAVRAIWRLTR